MVKNKYPYLPILAISGIYKKEELTLKACEAGADDTLNKPFSLELVILKLKKLLTK